MIQRKIWVLTLFPDYFTSFLDRGVVAKALNNERSSTIEFSFEAINIADYCAKGFKGVDSAPYGGGPGMVLRADVLKSALEEGVLKKGNYESAKELHIVCPAPRGRVWDGRYAKEFAEQRFHESSKDLVFICGRYEGIDERFLENYVDEFISLGDFILTGGEIVVMAILDSSMRFVESILGNKNSAVDESFISNRLEYPLYTRPAEFEGLRPPDVLLGGNHRKILDEQQKQKDVMTKKYRPDLFKKGD